MSEIVYEDGERIPFDKDKFIELGKQVEDQWKNDPKIAATREMIRSMDWNESP